MPRLQVPCGLDHPGQHHLDQLGQPGRRPASPQLCATTRNCVPQPGTTPEAGRPGRPADAPRWPIATSATTRRWWSTTAVTRRQAWPACAGTRSATPAPRPSIYQQGTYAARHAPGAGWAAWRMDHNGNMAVGYSASSSTVYPSHPLRRPPGERPAGHAGRRARPRCSPARGFQSGRQPLGRLQRHDRGPDRRLHLLVYHEYNSSGGWAWARASASFKFARLHGGPPPTADQHAGVRRRTRRPRHPLHRPTPRRPGRPTPRPGRPTRRRIRPSRRPTRPVSPAAAPKR